MKVTLLLGLPMLASAAVLEARQEASSQIVLKDMEDSASPARIVPGARRTLSRYGPFVIKGSAGGSSKGAGGMGMGMGMGMGDSTLSGQSWFPTLTQGICSASTNGPCTIFGGNVSVQFANKTKATPSNGVYIHHLLTTDRTKRVPSFLSSCDRPNSPGYSVSSLSGGVGFVGVGEDSGEEPVLYTQRNGKSNAGYLVNKGDVFVANVVLVNYNKEPVTVYVTYDLEWTPTPPPSNTLGMLISISQCMGKGSIKMSPSGPTNSTSGKFTFLQDGNILAARGHLHDGGSQVAFYINNKFVCSSKATYGGKESTTEVGGKQWQTIAAMSYCDGPIPVKKGDNLHLVVEYDLKAHPLRKSADGHDASGVMGMLSVTFAPNPK